LLAPSTDFHSSGARIFRKVARVIRSCVIALLLIASLRPARSGQFTVGTYNLELYLDAPAGTMKAKPDAAKAKIREALKAMNVDVLAVEEMGDPDAFAEFVTSLRAEGLDYPHTEYVQAADPQLHLAILSRYPIVARHSHTNESFLLNGRRMHVLRGFAEVDIQVGADYQFTLLSAHLKSKRQAGLADEEDVREQEALLLREKIDAILSRSPNANLIVLGDLNDFRDSRSTRAIIGRGKNTLVDTRPAERNGDTHAIASQPNAYRQITWTHFYAREDTYARIDYILLSRGMAHEWDPKATYVFTMPNWGLASDHRPLVATFSTVDK
jgi:endonuclease/exonuclease/phosphatase family metal-dependent hydrolase